MPRDVVGDGEPDPYRRWAEHKLHELLPEPEIDKVIHTRFARLFLEHRAELQMTDKSDAEIVDLSAATFIALMTAIVVGKRNNDQALLDRFAWFIDACFREFDGVVSRRAPTHRSRVAGAAIAHPVES